MVWPNVPWATRSCGLKMDSFNFNAILQPDLFYKLSQKWEESLYLQTSIKLYQEARQRDTCLVCMVDLCFIPKRFRARFPHGSPCHTQPLLSEKHLPLLGTRTQVPSSSPSMSPSASEPPPYSIKPEISKSELPVLSLVGLWSSSKLVPAFVPQGLYPLHKVADGSRGISRVLGPFLMGDLGICKEGSDRFTNKSQV